MTLAVYNTVNADSEGIAGLTHAGGDVSNVLSEGERWFKCDLTGDNNNGSLKLLDAGGLKFYVYTTRFKFDTNPTQRVSVCFSTITPRMVYLNTDRKLEFYDGTSYHVGSTVLVAGTVYEIATAVDNFDALARQLVWVNKVIEIDVRIPQYSGSMRYFGEDLGASNPGCSLYFTDLSSARDLTGPADWGNLFQYQVGHANARADNTVTWTQTPGAGEDHYEDLDDRPTDDGTTEVHTNTTAMQEKIDMDQRATIGVGESDTIDKAEAWFRVKSAADGGTKWDVDYGYGITPAVYLSSLDDPGSNWLWEGPLDCPNLDTPAELDDWQLWILTAASNHDMVAYWSTALAFIAYHNSSHALQKPRTRQPMVI